MCHPSLIGPGGGVVLPGGVLLNCESANMELGMNVGRLLQRLINSSFCAAMLEHVCLFVRHLFGKES